jgi:hypothetical protein
MPKLHTKKFLLRNITDAKMNLNLLTTRALKIMFQQAANFVPVIIANFKKILILLCVFISNKPKIVK